MFVFKIVDGVQDDVNFIGFFMPAFLKDFG